MNRALAKLRHKHVRQTATNDCGIASAAALAGVRYSQAKMILGRQVESRQSCSTNMFRDAVQSLTGEAWKISYRHKGQSLDTMPVAGRVGVLIRPSRGVHGHWIVVGEDGTVCDPALPYPVEMGDYKRRGEEVVRVVESCGRSK